jgi:hypothetical protein
MQIAFLTLFLGLVNGAQTVEISAGPGVAAVEVVLDGRGVTRLDGAPWQARVDFGRALLPHHLEARGLAAAGGEVAHAEQWVNLPRPPAEVEIVLEGAAATRNRTARIAWESLDGEPPQELRLNLDGAPLALDAQGRAPLVLPRAGAAHVLSAEARFAGGAQARKDLVLTGDYGGDVATELTAVPVRSARPGRPLAVKDLQGLLLVDGQPARVAAVEQEPAEVFVVRAYGAETWLFGRAMRLSSSAYEYAHFKPDPHLRFHFVSAVARRSTSNVTARASEVFDVSRGLHDLPPRYDLLRLLLAIRYDLEGRPQLADAVAVAGLYALARQTPRAVVLLAGRGDGAGGGDASLFLPAAVRGYLAAVGVPLFVWSTSSGKDSLRREDWGAIEDVSTPAGIAKAYRRLESEVLAQQIVWIEGRHLPQSVRLAPVASGTASPGGPGPAAAGGGPAAVGLALVAAPPPSP